MIPSTCSRPSAVASAASSDLFLRSAGIAPSTSALRTPSGPASRNLVAGIFATLSVKRTVSRTWLTQYSGSVTSPVALIGIFGAVSFRSRIALRKSSSIGSINGEWNAWLTRSLLFFHCRAMASTSSSSPAITTLVGPLTAAIDTLLVRCLLTSSSVACTATMAPVCGRACIRLARALTSFAASSRLSTPATCAAAISPIE